MLTTSTLPAIIPVAKDHPYELPQITPILEETPAENPSGLAQRCGVYALTGLLLYAFFGTPLNVLYWHFCPQAMWMGQGWVGLLSIVASSLIVGLILDPLVRMKVHSAFTGLGFMSLTAMLFLFLMGLFGNFTPPHGVDRITYMLPWIPFFAFFGCLYGIPVVGPICFGAIYLAGRLVDAPQESK